MFSVTQIEKYLHGLYKNAPALPRNVRDSLAKATPWLALIYGILQILGAFALAGILSQANRIEQAYDRAFGTTANIPVLSSAEEILIYIGIGLLFIQAVLLLLSVPRLMRFEYKGWGHLFLVFLINVLYAVTALFISDRSISSFLWNILVCVIGFYLLFQIRGHFEHKDSHTSHNPKETK